MPDELLDPNDPLDGLGTTDVKGGPFSQDCLNLIFHVSPTRPNHLISRESGRLEFKKSFNWDSRDKYTRTCAGFANAKGGYIVFGIENNPRRMVGLQGQGFENIDPQKITEFFNEYLAPEIEWQIHIHEISHLQFGILYVKESRNKPVICKKTMGKDLKEGEIYYRYRGRTSTILYPELRTIIDGIRGHEHRLWLKHLKQIARIGVREAGIFDLNSGKVTGANGAFIIDESLLQNLQFIKEGEFDEVSGSPVIKIIGNAQVVGPGMLASTRKIIKTKTKAIRTPDIILAFLENRKVDEPEEYIKQICFESSGFLPVYHFMRQARLKNDDLIPLLQKVQSTSQAKVKLLARLSGTDNLVCSLPSTTTVQTKAKIAIRDQLLKREVLVDGQTDLLQLRYLLQAIRALEPRRIDDGYLRPLLTDIFNRYYGQKKGSITCEIRYAICFVDAALNKEITSDRI